MKHDGQLQAAGWDPAHEGQAHPGLQPVLCETLTILLLDFTVSLFTKALLGAKAEVARGNPMKQTPVTTEAEKRIVCYFSYLS